MAARDPARGLVPHTDRGSQSASNDYRKALSDLGAVQSMSRKGDRWDVVCHNEARSHSLGRSP